MCGIAGIVERKGAGRGRERRARVLRMCDALAHRGPDGGDVAEFGRSRPLRAVFGHRRLAVLDPSDAGRQPMVRHGYAITFNGEIFNHRDLGRRLGRGVSFRSGTDTEVLLEGLYRQGLGFLDELNGMFAFALWDPEAEAVHLVRDRFGVKPLYYADCGSEVVFASEPGALVEALDQALELDDEAIALYLTLGYIPSPWSIYRCIRKLPPGHLLTISSQSLHLRRWYTLPLASPEQCLDTAAAIDHVRWTLDDAVRLRLIADRPLGAFLSGGLDSSIISALAVRHVSGPFQTFSMVFEGESMFDERAYARAVAAHLGTEHHEIGVSPADLLDAIPQVLTAQDEPFGDSSLVATWLLSRETRRRVVVSLSGDGADELFGGYRKYQGEMFQSYYSRIPAGMRERVIEPLVARLPESRGSWWLEGPRRVRRFIDGADERGSVRALKWMTLFGPETLEEVGGSRMRAARGVSLIGPRIEQWYNRPIDALNRPLHVDTQLVLPDQMLTKVDRASMQHGLEVRPPFLDYRVVELAFRISGTEKIRLGRGKWIVLEAFRDLLPSVIHRRPKRGFELPLANWLRGPLWGLYQDVLRSSASHAQPYLDTKALGAMLDAHRRYERDHTPRLWTALCLLWWLRKREKETHSIRGVPSPPRGEKGSTASLPRRSFS